jgi:dipeptidyl aminopeptidase/acylaminoacyl peptidase
MKKIISFVLLIGIIMPCASSAQQKKRLTKADYGMWSFMVSNKLSDHGNWAYYTLLYDDVDTLFVRHTKTGRLFTVPHATGGEFNGEKLFACKTGDRVLVQDLVSGKATSFSKAYSAAFCGDGKKMLLAYRQADGKDSLVISSLAGGASISIAGVTEWEWDGKRTRIAYAAASGSTNTAAVYSLADISSVVADHDQHATFANPTWQGSYVAFTVDDGKKGSVLLFDAVKKKLDRFNPENAENFPAGMSVSSLYRSLKISEGGDRVFFKLKEPAAARDSAAGIVEVWNADDRQLNPNKKAFGDLTLCDKDGVWFTKTGSFLQLTDRSLPGMVLNSAKTHALIWDPLAYEPQSVDFGPRDVYIINLSTGRKKLILKKHSARMESLMLSPGGRYVAYPQEGNWWIYDIEKDRHTNLTKKLPATFQKVDYDWAGEKPLYHNPGWTPGGRSILLYDQFDIWEIAPDGGEAKRLTHGREDGTVFRFEPAASGQKNNTLELETITGTYDLSGKLVLTTANKKLATTGYALWYNGRIRSLVDKNKRIDRLLTSADGQAFTFVEQDYDAPPRLMSRSLDGAVSEVFQSNPQHFKYYWGHSERVYYNVDGKDLSGVLIFPAEYQPGKKYPMVLEIYERKDYHLHEYVMPTVYNEGGMNFANMSAKGYFVFLPDIVYKMGEMGDSAKRCVLAAVDAVIAKGFVDSARVGLFGHSFGGFEVDYIITQTDRFAAAVSGAAMTDMLSCYFYIGGNMQTPDFWRFEHHQQRMDKSIFEDPEIYLKNSPVLLAQGVKTPLLSFTGADDRHVNYYQSIEFYLALRRLGKEHTLLVYPNEQHVLMNRPAQADLTFRFEQWFDKYLKKVNDRNND